MSESVPINSIINGDKWLRAKRQTIGDIKARLRKLDAERDDLRQRLGMAEDSLQREVALRLRAKGVKR